MLKGIDVSEHQGVLDWSKVKNQIDFAILRCGYGGNIASQDDKQWRRNAAECTRLGIPFGVYIYSYANSVQKAKSEAQHVLRLIKNYKLSYPVYYDLEDNTVGKCSNNLITNIAKTFCSIIEKAGYWCGIYANTYWWNNKLTDSRFNKWVKWVAQYNNKCTYSGEYGIWQYSSSGRVSGISGNVDVNYCYKDYSKLINNVKKVVKNTEENIKKYDDKTIPSAANIFKIPNTQGYIEQAKDGRLIIHKDRGNYISINKGCIDAYWNDNKGHAGHKKISD